MTDRPLRRGRRPRRAVGVMVMGALVVASGLACGSSAPVATSRPAGATTTSTRVPLAGLGFSDRDNGRLVTVAAGQRLTVILHSADFVFLPSSDPAVVAGAGPPTVTAGGPPCVEVAGSGCGTVVASFIALAVGNAELSADRPGCVEPTCSVADAQWRLLVRVEPGGIVSTVPPPTTTASTDTRPPTTIGKTPPSPDGEVRGMVLFSPVCPVERIPPDPACAPRPGPADVELVVADGSVAGAVSAGDEGAFAIAAAAGSYSVRATAPGPGPGGGGCQVEPAEVTVEPGASVTVTVSCDTGIR